MSDDKNEPTENKEKQKPAFYIFVRDGEEKTTNVGAAFSQKNGKGLNIIIGQKRYEAYPPKVKPTNG